MKRKHQRLLLAYLLGVMTAVLVCRELALENVVEEMRIERTEQVRTILSVIREGMRGQ